MRQEQKKNITSGLAFILFGIFLYVGSFWIPPTTSDILGSRFFPRVVAFLIVFLGAVQTVLNAAALKKNTEPEAKKEKKAFNKPLAFTCVALVAYYILILQIGFTITSILYLLCQSALLMPNEDLKNPKKMAVPVLVSIIIPIALNAIFWNVFSIQLPVGKLF